MCLQLVSNILCAFHIDSDLVLSIAGTNILSAPASWNVAISYKIAVLEQVKANAAATRSFGLTSAGTLPVSVNIHVGWGAENAGKQAVQLCSCVFLPRT